MTANYWTQEWRIHSRTILKFPVYEPSLLIAETREFWLLFLNVNGWSLRPHPADFSSLKRGVALLCATANLP